MGKYKPSSPSAKELHAKAWMLRSVRSLLHNETDTGLLVNNHKKRLQLL